MKPWTKLAEARSPGGEPLVLQERDGLYVIRDGGRELMTSATHDSEEAMVAEGLKGLEEKAPVVLVGGLGMGFTLGAALKRLPAEARVVVAEISAAIIEWNRGILGKLAGSPLEDPRVTIELLDVSRLLAASSARFHAILL
ncbi:MAG TPA: hypothetical protein VH208_03100, partial [Myxococcaceae bacterium]|nr:hypothetical protein [Myxococcaceae bacterium]